MADYAASVTSSMLRAVKVDNVTGIGIYAGVCDITNYNTTLAEITGITGKFHSVISVTTDGATENGYLVSWVPASGAFKAWRLDYDAGADGELIEASTDDDVGTVNFLAIGII